MIVLPSASAFFERWPLFGFPGFNGVLVTLGGALHWLLHTVSDPSEKATHVRGVIAHAEPLFDQLGNSCRAPHRASKPMGFCHSNPLAHRTFARAQGISDLFLGPSLLVQLPGPQPSPLFPIACMFVCSSHSSILAEFSKPVRAQ